jgi:simple sugar transport system ATP-binding protein
MRDAGLPVIVVSTELDEATQLGDRIMVMYKGAVVGIVPADTPRDVLGLMMAGISPDSIPAAQAPPAQQPMEQPTMPTATAPETGVDQ